MYGMFLCDLSCHLPFRELINKWNRTRKTVMITCFALGWYVAGYPGEHHEWAAWSQQLRWIGQFFMPPDEHLNWGKRYSAIGWQLIAFAIVLSPGLQEMFSNRMFMWFGKQSFAVYLLHGTLLRGVLARMVYGFSTDAYHVTQNEKGEDIHHWLPRAGHGTFAIAIPIWFVMVYGCAHLWTTYVDPACARWTAKLEKLTFEQEDEKSALPR